MWKTIVAVVSAQLNPAAVHLLFYWHPQVCILKFCSVATFLASLSAHIGLVSCSTISYLDSDFFFMHKFSCYTVITISINRNVLQIIITNIKKKNTLHTFKAVIWCKLHSDCSNHHHFSQISDKCNCIQNFDLDKFFFWLLFNWNVTCSCGDGRKLWWAKHVFCLQLSKLSFFFF